LYPLEELNELNRIYFSRLSSRSDIMVVPTTINGIYCIRFAVGAQRTEDKHIRDAHNIFEAEAKTAIEVWQQDTTS
jgi:aromatic-L-amino-acid decarboxylase